MNYTSNCPICLSSALKTVYRFNDFSVLKCRTCRSSWRSNMYDQNQIIQIYCDEAYQKHPYFSYEKDEIENLMKERFKSYSRALDYLESVIGLGRLLDVGCGSGAFLSIAKRRGWSVDGIEIAPGLSKISERNTNSEIVNCSFEEANMSQNHYDVVSFWDIIEHLVDPISALDKARTLLRPGGIVLLCTPNEQSLLARAGWILYELTGSYYNYPALALHPSAHTYFFSKSCLKRLLEESKFRVIRCYSQEAFFDHSPLAGRTHKLVIGLIEKVARIFDHCYELVIFAES